MTKIPPSNKKWKWAQRCNIVVVTANYANLQLKIAKTVNDKMIPEPKNV